MDNNSNTQLQNLITPNVYISNNQELGNQIINGFIDENNALRQMWGYEEVKIVNGEIQGKILAQLVTSKKYLVCCDKEGVYILQNISHQNSKEKRFAFINFSNGSYHRKFKDVRIKDETTGKDKYSNGYKYLANEDGFSICQSETLQTADNQAFGGFIYITDGSVGGLYILTITDDFIELFQFDYAKIQLGSQATVIPYVDGKVIHCVSPSKVTFFNQKILLVDERWNYITRNTKDITSSYFYAVAGLGLNLADKSILYSVAEVSQQFKMAKPIVTAEVLSNIAYIFSEDRIEFYTPAYLLNSQSLTGISKINSNAVEIGVESRNLIYNFNGNIVFIGSSGDKRRSLYFFEGGKSEPIEFTKNNLSYLFNNEDFDPAKISLTAFSTTTQEFAIINGLGRGKFGSYSLMIEITQKDRQEFYEQKSTTLTENTHMNEKIRFKSDEIFNLNNEYYFVSYEDKKIFYFSQFISDFNGKPIILEIRSNEFTAPNLKNKLDIKLNSLVMQKMPEDWLHPYNAIEYLPHLVDKNYICFEAFYKSSIDGKEYKIGKKSDYFPINTTTMRYDNNLHLMSNTPRGQVRFKFYPKIYERNNKLYASINTINSLSLQVRVSG